MTIYIASSKKNVGIIQEDVYIRDELISKGFKSEIATLSDIINKSNPCDTVILKSIWGYHINYNIFLNQILRLEKKGVQLINDYKFIYWNIDKSKYLMNINSFSVIPTYKLLFSDVNNTSDVIKIINKATINDENNIFVIKPAISASGYLTFLYNKNNNSGIKNFSNLLINKKLIFLAQPYRPKIIEGEPSIILIDGQIQYGVNRFPGILNIKKETEYIELSKISKSILDQINNINKFFTKNFKKIPKICRVDFLKHDSHYEILEIELIDPDLFLRKIPENIRRKTISLLCEI